MDAPIWVGTSGYQYPEWRGSFYPETLSKPKMLAYYSERFSTTEVNYTFRRMPSDETFEAWAAGTPARFRFSAKAPQKITHFAKLRDCSETVRFFAKRVETLGEKLGVILFQLPPSLKADLALLSDFVAELPNGMRAAFEFRHASWFQDAVFAVLEKRNAALCIADTDDLQTPFQRTADFLYLRLRREDYKPRDLAQWVKKIRGTGRKPAETFVYFKHEETGIGPKFAGAFLKKLGTL